MQRISSIALLLLFIAAQSGVTFGTHYCQGEAVKTSVLFGNQEVPDCGMEEHDRNCEKNGPVFSKNCCEDERTTFRNEREQLPSSPGSIEAPRQEVKLLHNPLADRKKPSFFAKHPDRDRSPPSASRSSVSRLHSVQLQVFRL